VGPRQSPSLGSEAQEADQFLHVKGVFEVKKNEHVKIWKHFSNGGGAPALDPLLDRIMPM
jgi:hypothetical protein